MHKKMHSSNVRVNPSVADYHSTNGEAAPQLVGRLGDFKAAATAAVSFGCDDEHVVVPFRDDKIRAQCKPLAMEHSLASVSVAFIEAATDKHLAFAKMVSWRCRFCGPFQGYFITRFDCGFCSISISIVDDPSSLDSGGNNRSRIGI